MRFQPALLLAAIGLAWVPAEAGPPSSRPLPISAHNCYPLDSSSNERLAEALRLGIDNIEIDLGWDEANRRLIVGHDAEPRPGVTYPLLEPYIVPALQTHWRTPRSDRAPTVLTIDWKTSRPEAVRQLKAFLDEHSDWFSSAPRADPSPLEERRLTVCFTGSDAAKDLYDAMIPAGGTYRAFRDRVFSGGHYQQDLSGYAPARATSYHRFLTFHWGIIEAGGPALAGPWTVEDARRLDDLMALVHRQGFRARFYCLNGHVGPLVGPYRFRDDASARIRWKAAADAGVDWIATDEYSEIVAALKGP